MLKSTKIMLTSPLGEEYEVKGFSDVTIDEDVSVMIKNFIITATFLDNKEIDKFDIGTEVKIYHGEKGKELPHIFTGIVDKSPKSIFGKMHSYQLVGTCYLGRTQDRIINESYQDMFIHEIFQTLITNYAPYLSFGEIQTIGYKISVSFSDTKLFDALQRLARAIDFNIEVDKDKKIHFVKATSKNNPYNILEGSYKKGTANFSIDSTRMVNELIIRGGQGLSNDITDIFFANGVSDIYSLRYQPTETRVYVNNVEKTVSVDNFSDTNPADVYIDYQNRAIRFNVMPAANAEIKVIYKRYYNLKKVLNEFSSQKRWGIKSDIVIFEGITEESDLMKRGNEYLKRNANPRISGGLRPFENKWKVGESVKVIISSLGVNDVLYLTSKSLQIKPNISEVELRFDESPIFTTTLAEILKRINDVTMDAVEIVQSSQTTFDNIQTAEKLVIKSRSANFRIGASLIGDVI
jgi:hypothetical protein